jgi:hypothetical protein
MQGESSETGGYDGEVGEGKENLNLGERELELGLRRT